MPDWDPEANELFLRAVELPTPEERNRFLDGACAGKPDLRDRVDRLLRAGAEAGSFLERPAAAPEFTAVHVPATPGASPAVPTGPGTAGGRYKLLEVIGEGGMGTVWLAEQTEPVRRKVALKVVKSGMDSGPVLARFEAERQALALMDHPNIAKVFDGGATADGRPYFVMELVKGVPITRYCDDHRLPPRQRLELFVSVCQAVQHAHQKGVIHRDLKPSNVLVAPYDGRPVPKVIDFGIAKATGQALTERTLFTGLGAVVGTPEYMSPEQAELNNADIDTRSDIFALGVLLYELLTGSTPLTRKRVKEAALLEVLRLVREEEPPKPSTRLSDSKDSLPALSAQRQSEPGKLTRLVRGELDWIVMKALEKDRNRRYETANGFAADVRRYLADEPVQACPPSAKYRLRKFLRRNKLGVSVVSSVALVLALGITGTTIGLIRALAERDQKEEARRQTERERDQKEQARRQTERERDQKIVALQQTERERDQKEEARRQAVGNLRKAWRAYSLVTHDVVEDLLGRQVQLTDQHRAFLKKILVERAALADGADDPEGRRNRAEGLFLVGLIRDRLGEFREAETAYRAAATLQKQLADAFPKSPEYRYDLALSYSALGVLLKSTGKPKEAETAARDGLALRKQLVAEWPKRGEYRHELVASHINLGSLLDANGRLKEAEASYRDALKESITLVSETPGSVHFQQDLAHSHGSLAVFLLLTGRPKAAEEALRDSLTVRRRVAGAHPPHSEYDLANALVNMAGLLRDTGANGEAGESYTEALSVLKRLAADFPSRPDYRSELALCKYGLGKLLHQTGRSREALVSVREALALQKQLAGDHPDRTDYSHALAKILTGLGGLLDGVGEVGEAEALHRDAIALLKPLVTGFPLRTEFRQDLALCYMNLGSLLRGTGRPGAAEAAFGAALNIQKKLCDDFPTRSDYRSDLAGTYYNRAVLLSRTGQAGEGVAAWESALELSRQLTIDFPHVPDHHDAVARTLSGLATLHRAAGRFDKAGNAYREALEIGKRLVTDNPKRDDFRSTFALTQNNFGVLLYAMQRREDAASTFKDALPLWKQLVADSPGRADFRQELARTSANLGAVLSDLKGPDAADAAEAAYIDAIAQLKELRAAVPTRPDYSEELARAYTNLGKLLWATRRPKDAERAWHDVLDVRRKQVVDFPGSADYRNELAGILVDLAKLHRNRTEFDIALALLKEARPHHDAALKVKPDDPNYRRFYRNHLLHLTGCQLGLSNFAQAAATAEELARFGYDPANDNYEAARFLCGCVIGVGTDDKLDEDKRKELARSYADRALELLRRAVASGFKDAARIKRDPAFGPIREREEYATLLAGLEEKAKE